MKIIAGLGNPGAEYASTPHSVGFEAVDAIAAEFGSAWEEKRPFRELIGQEPVVREHMTEEELDACFDLSYHYKHVDEVFRRLGLEG